MKNTDKKTNNAVKKEDKVQLKTPAEIKEIIEKKKFAGYYKTKVRFIN